MRPWLALALLVLAIPVCRAQAPSAFETDPNGWTDIMPNSAFDGWIRRPFVSPATINPVSQWKVDTANRILLCEGNLGHEWLRYDRELTNSIFHVEFRFTPIEGGKGYNSGIIVRANADETIWYQAQVGDAGTGYLFGRNMVEGKPAGFNLRTSLKEDRVLPPGQWNVYEVRAEGPKITFWANGGVSCELPSVSALKGYSGLEAEGYRIEFRNIKLKELK